MAHRMPSIVVLVAEILLSMSALAAAQSNSHAASQAPAQGAPNKPPPAVQGGGTPGTVPVWTGATTLGDSHIQSGVAVNVTVPLHVSGTVTMDGGGGNLAVAGGNGIGIAGSGTSAGVSGTGPNYGVVGDGAIGVQGTGTNGPGLVGDSAASDGVSGTTSNFSNAGVTGFNSESITGGIGVRGIASGPGGIGVYGEAPKFGVFGQSVLGIGVQGSSETNAGVFGYSRTIQGVFGESSFIGVSGHSDIGIGVEAIAQGTKPALYANNATGLAAQFDGNFSVNGTASKPGGGSWSVLSDVRTKKSVEPIGNALGQLLKLRGVTYEYTNASAFHELTGVHIGMVAQDVEQVFPSWVDTGTDGYKRLTFRGFEAVTVEAVRELDTSSKEAMARIADLERQNSELRHAIEVLSAAVITLQQK